MWLVVLASKNPWVVHSIHETAEEAKAWAACKEHDGDDTHVVFIEREMLSDLFAVTR